MSAHTPEPWHVTAPDEISVGSNDGRIAILTNLRGALGMSGRRNPDEVMANARLIAAAPKLLEAVKTFAEWLRREETGFPGGGEAAWREWYDGNLALCQLAQDQASAAIAEATGAQS